MKRHDEFRCNPDDPADPASPDDMGECDKCQESVPVNDLVRVRDANGDELLWCAECAVDAHECERQRCRNGDLWAVRTRVLVDSEVRESWCSDCVSEHTGTCERHRCSNVYDSDSAEAYREVDGDGWCIRCVENYATYCEAHDGYTGEGTTAVHTRGGGTLEWCQSCRDSDAYWCEECDEYSTDEHDHEYEKVVAPYHGAQRRGIKFKPCVSDWTRKQPKPLYFGVELEVLVPRGRDREPYAQQVLDSIGPKFGDFLYDIQHDGSLGIEGKSGFEIITQPCGLDTHRECWSDADFTNLTNDRNGIKAGLHVHISRSAFKKVGGIDLSVGGHDLTIERHPVVARMAAFLYADENKKFVESIARRTFNEYARYLADVKVSGATRGTPLRFSGHEAHYEALNLSSGKTVEFRLPKSTTEPTTIMATLEFVFLLLRFCEQASNEELDVKHFKKFIVEDRWSTDSRFLRAYLVDRELATWSEMKLPKKKPTSEDAAVIVTSLAAKTAAKAAKDVRTNPSRRPRLDDDTPGHYARMALAEYRRTGE